MYEFIPHDHFEVVLDPDDNRQWCVRRLKDNKIMAYGSVTTMCRWLYAWGAMYQ